MLDVAADQVDVPLLVVGQLGIGEFVRSYRNVEDYRDGEERPRRPGRALDRLSRELVALQPVLGLRAVNLPAVELDLHEVDVGRSLATPGEAVGRGDVLHVVAD